MSHGPPGTTVAPEIPGYTYVRPIGHGGFSDVYLYEQEMPRREVAIKVLRTDDLSEATREQFAAEANLMARVSNHSNIAAIFAADVDDDGQPYLVMEYCSGGSLGAFYRHYPMSVKNVLSLGIRLCGALEAAHQAGIVHRDVKPANILLTEYGVPVLSDFGISTIAEDFPESTKHVGVATSSGGTGDSSVGMSLPWAAPETLWDDPVSDARSDRFSLAATLYSLLEGRSPREVPGGPNGSAHLTGRIKSGFIAAMKRPDVPPSLQAVLRTGLAHDRASRYDSAADMGRALQDVQRELGFEVTPLEVPRGAAPSRPPAPTTRVHQDQPIQLPAGHATLMPDDNAAEVGTPVPGPVPTPAVPASLATAPPWAGPPQPTSGPAAPVPLTAPASATATPAPGRSSTWRLVYGAFVAVLVVACVVVASLLIARANRGPDYTGPAIDYLEAVANDAGTYRVTIPEELPPPDAVESRVLSVGAGDALDGLISVRVSTDSSEWLDGETVTLNPMDAENHDASVSVAPEELGGALGMNLSELHVEDVVLVAAPAGYFANTHPELGINDTEASLVIVTILDGY